MTGVSSTWGADGLKPSARGTKATCMAWISPPGAFWAPDDSRGATDSRIPAWLRKYDEAIKLFEQFAADRGVHPAHVAIAWLRHSPAVTSVITGVSALQQLQPLIDAFAFDRTDAE